MMVLLDDAAYLEKLILDHWAYIEGLLDAHGTADDEKEIARYHYCAAFKHGWKHHGEYMIELEEANGLDSL